MHDAELELQVQRFAAGVVGLERARRALYRGRMRIVLYVLALLFGLGGFYGGFTIMKSAVSAIHELEALTCFLISAVSFGTLAIAGALETMIQRDVERERRAQPVIIVEPPAK